jgi:DNA-binding XRE family transcriptional regulator
MTSSAQPMFEEARKRLLFPCKPILGESLPGFVARVAATNCLDNPAWLLQAAGVPSPSAHDLSKRVTHKIDELADVLCVPREALAQLRIGGLVEGRPNLRQFFGAEIRQTYLVHDSRRLSPASLATSAHHRAAWMLSPLTFCAESWDVLIGACPRCGRKLAWTRSRGIDICEHCDADLKMAPTTKVEPADRPALSFIAGLVAPDPAARAAALERAPPMLEHLTSGELFELAMIFAREVSRQVGNGGVERHSKLAAGARLVLNYRGQLPLPEDKRINANVPKALLRLRREAASVGQPNIRGVLETSAFVDVLGETGPVRLRRLREAANLLTLTQAAAILGIERAVLRELTTAGLLVGETRDGLSRQHTWFRPEHVAAMTQRLNRRMSPDELTRQTNLSSQAITALLARRLIKPNNDPIVRRCFKGVQLDRKSVDRFLSGMQRSVRRCDPAPDWLPLEAAFALLPGGAKPWGDFFTQALSGKLLGHLACPHPVSEVSEICVSAAVTTTMRAEVSSNPPAQIAAGSSARYVSRLEAQTYLRCYPRDISWLVQNGHLGRADDLKNGLRWDLILAFGKEHISTAEICDRTDHTYSDVHARLKDFGLARVTGVFWRRRDVEAFMEDVQAETPLHKPRAMDDVVHDFGHRVRTERRRAGWSQTRLSSITEIHQGMISEIENGLANPTLKTIVALANAFGMDASMLLDTKPREGGNGADGPPMELRGTHG